MYKVRYWIVTPTAVREGTAMSTSPKKAYASAINGAYDSMVGCESIGVEGYTMWLNGKLVRRFCDLD